MATIGWAALILSVFQGDPNPGECTIASAGRQQSFPGIEFRRSPEAISIGSSSSPGPQFRLVKAGDGWMAATSRQCFYYRDGSGGEVQRLEVEIESEEQGRLVGSWSGKLACNNRLLPVSGKFNLSPSPLDAKPNLFLGGFGCVVLAFVLIINLGVNVWFISVAFQESVLWGIAVILVPFAPIAFIALHWDAARRPFLWSLACAGFSFCALMGIAAAA